MSFIVVIPSRYQSTRLPGKPLADIGGKPMIQHVYERAQLSEAVRVVVATDDQRIGEVVQGFSGEVVMTSPDHPSGTDRLAEVAGLLNLSGESVVVNVQGDEPLIPAAVINQVATNLIVNKDFAAATLSHGIRRKAEFLDKSAVKVVSDSRGQALYFSRAPIPWPRDLKLEEELPASFSPQRHIGIYAYRASLLTQFVTWSKSPLEELESLEQLRILHMGQMIHVEPSCESVPAGVDTPEDLERVRKVLLNPNAAGSEIQKPQAHSSHKVVE